MKGKGEEDGEERDEEEEDEMGRMGRRGWGQEKEETLAQTTPH